MSVLYGGVDPVLLHWAHHSVFTNATTGDRWIWDPFRKELHGPYATNVPAIATFLGKRWYQSEFTATNSMVDIDSWTVRNDCTATGSQLDPSGGTGAYLIEGVKASSTSDLFYQVNGGTNDAAYSPSIFIKRGSTSGMLRLLSPKGGAFGQAEIDMSLLAPSGWDRLTTDHAAVTITNPFINNGTGQGGLYFIEVSGGPLHFSLWYPQMEETAYPSSPIAPLATRASDSMLFTASQIPQIMREGKWQYSVITAGTQVEDPPGGTTGVDFHFGASPSTPGMRISHITNARAQVFDVRASSTKVLAANGTWGRNQIVTSLLDTVAGNVTVSGQTTGNGVHSGSTWSGVIPTTDDLRIGHLFNTVSFHTRGLIAEPRPVA